MSDAVSVRRDTRPVAERRVPALGGFNLDFLRLEVRRLLRNRRTTIVTLIVPVGLYFLFKGGGKHGVTTIDDVSIDSYVMVSLAVYGAMLASTAGGAMVAVERALGWSRQLRLTPLRPLAYMAVKVGAAMTLGLISVLVIFTVGKLTGVSAPIRVWTLCGLLAWLGSAVYAALGLMIGYLVPSENVMQLLGPVMALSAFLGGLFVPVNELGSTFENIAKFTPAYGMGEIARSPLVQSGFTLGAVANVVGWTIAFSIGAMLLFRRDTKRV